MRYNPGSVNKALPTNAAMNKVIPKNVQTKLGIKSVADAKKFVKSHNSTEMSKILTKAGMSSGARASLTASVSSGGVGQGVVKGAAFSAMAVHAKADLIKNASHDEKLYNDTLKKFKEAGDVHGVSRFMQHVAKEKEIFRDRMRAESLHARLEMESKDNYKFGNQKVVGQASGGSVAKSGTHPAQPGPGVNGSQASLPAKSINQFFGS